MEIMPKIYLAGTIYSKKYGDSEEAITWKETFIDSIQIYASTFFDPNPQFGNGKEVVPRDKRLIEESDYLVAYIDRVTVGTTMELLHAFNNNCCVFVITPHEDFGKHPWVDFHVSKVFRTPIECAEYINRSWQEIKVTMR